MIRPKNPARSAGLRAAGAASVFAFYFYLTVLTILTVLPWRLFIAPAAAAVWRQPLAGRFDDSTISVLIDRKKYLSEISIVPGGSFRSGPPGRGREVFFSTAVFTGRCGNSRFDFPGELEISSGGGWYYLINRVTVRDYIACVLPSELESAEPELMRAMAALVRTLVYGEALRKACGPGHARHPYADFSLCARTHCASYRGILSREKFAAALRAVEETSGEVLFYGDNPVRCFYSACCGGRVKKAGDLYPGASGEAYFEQKDCPCASSAKIWKTLYPRAGLSRALGVAVSSVETGSPPYRVVVNAKFGYSFDEFISALEKSPLPRLKSSEFTAYYDTGSDSFVFEGRGFGHGAGLCIAGARVMARRGDDYKKILNYYYKSCILKRVDL